MADRATLQIAFHECGNVLAAIATGATVRHVSVRPLDKVRGIKGRTLGRVALAGAARTPKRIAKETSSPHRRRALAVDQARVALAGPAGEELYLGRMTGDFSIWIDADYAWQIFGEGHDVFDACELVSFAYKSGNPAARVMKEYRAVRTFLAEHRTVLERLAAAVVEREDLDEKDIARVVGSDLDVSAWRRPQKAVSHVS